MAYQFLQQSFAAIKYINRLAQRLRLGEEDQRKETMKPKKFSASVLTRAGKFYGYKATAIGKADVQQPTTFQPDFDEEQGPFGTEEQANARMKRLLVEQS